MYEEHSRKLIPDPERKELFQLLGRIDLPASINALIPQSILRHGFGKRFLTIPRLLAAISLVTGSFWVWLHGVRLWSFWLLPPHKVTWDEVMFLSFFFVGSLGNFIVSRIRQFQGRPFHAYHRGISWLAWLKMPLYITYAIAEPMLVLSLAVWSPSGFVSAWLVISGLSLLVHVHITRHIYGFTRDDRSASEIEAEEFQTTTIEKNTLITRVVTHRR